MPFGLPDDHLDDAEHRPRQPHLDVAPVAVGGGRNVFSAITVRRRRYRSAALLGLRRRGDRDGQVPFLDGGDERNEGWQPEEDVAGPRKMEDERSDQEQGVCQQWKLRWRRSQLGALDEKGSSCGTHKVEPFRELSHRLQALEHFRNEIATPARITPDIRPAQRAEDPRARPRMLRPVARGRGRR